MIDARTVTIEELTAAMWGNPIRGVLAVDSKISLITDDGPMIEHISSDQLTVLAMAWLLPVGVLTELATIGLIDASHVTSVDRGSDSIN